MFGRAKQGYTFSDRDGFDEYTKVFARESENLFFVWIEVWGKGRPIN